MKTKLLGMIAAVLMTGTANAATYSMQFTAIGFVDANGVGGAPTDPVNGTFVYTADAPGGPISAFNSVSLNIAGHPYALNEVGYQDAGANIGLIGGKLNGVNQINGGTTDFFLEYNAALLTPLALYYGVPGPVIWDTWRFSSFSVTELQTPLPAALPLFATGLGALGLLGWRRKRKAQAAA